MRTSILRAFFFVLVVSAIVLLPGCGWGGDDSSVSTKTTNTTIVNNPIPPPTTPTTPTPITPIDPVQVTPTAPTAGTVYSLETEVATYLSDTAVTMNGRLDVIWVSDAEYAYFQIRQSGYGWESPISIGRPGRGPVSKPVAGRVPNTTYDYQLVVKTGMNSRTFGSLRSFTTLASPPVVSGEPTTPTSPIPNPDPVMPTNPTTPTPNFGPVVTGNATSLSANSATLNGSVNGISWANGGAAYFLVSTTKQQPWVTQDAGQPVGNVTTTVANLTPDTDYWARLITITGVGVPIKGEWVAFHTGPGLVAGTSPTFQPSSKAMTTRSMPMLNQADAQTRGYVNLTMDGATLLGYVYCNSERYVNVWFQYSTDGENWSNIYVGGWDKDSDVKYPLYGLSSGTTYKYRLAIGSYEDKLRYGEDFKFTTLVSSEYRDGLAENVKNDIANMSYQVENVRALCEGSYMGDDGFVASVYESMEQANANEWFAWHSMSSPELSGAIPSGLAQNFIEADKRLTEVRTQFGTLCERAANASWNVGDSTVAIQPVPVSYKASPKPTQEGVMKKAGELSGRNDITFAEAVGPEAPDAHYDNRPGIYKNVVNALIDGVEASKQIINRTRWETNPSDYWGARYVTNMAIRSYLAVVVIDQFIALPEVKGSLDTDTKVRLRQMKDEMTAFRMEMRGYEDDVLSARQKQSRSYQQSSARFVTGIKFYPNEGMGKAEK